MYFKINNQDFSSYVSAMRIGYETLVSDNSGRNAAGNTVIDIVNQKYKVYITFRHTTAEEMAAIMAAISDYVCSISFLEPKTQQLKTINAYTGTPEPEYYTIQNEFVVYKPMTINFIEL